LPFKLLAYWEHYDSAVDENDLIVFEEANYGYDFKKKRGNQPCYTLSKNENGYHLSLSYYIGVDWIELNRTALYVSPKLNTRLNEKTGNEAPKETNYIKMLFDALKHQEIASEIDELFEIKWGLPEIEIQQKQDLLTPLLVVQFLSLLKTIVRKGLKKSYYKVELNLHGKIKGKVLTGKTIKQNLFKNKSLNTYCAYDEFGWNGLENRLLKKALVFIQRYLPAYSHLGANDFAIDLFNYITPAFEMVSEEVQVNDIKFTRNNAFYKEYGEAIRLAKLILKRFGYNISNTETGKITTPPFWIDMSKLFELYVLGLLKDRFKNSGEVKYQFSSYWNELDYLLNTPNYKMVVDAKYKEHYQSGFKNEDIRQVSGYARLKSVYDELKRPYNEIIDCLIIYPDQELGFDDLKNVDLKKVEIKEFVQVYKMGIKLPLLD
jgi:5-methylcytosine-specific restriction enzyme subunit McrC